jgi:hypothetical protein
VLGIAVDLEGLRLHYAKNGRWLTGTPSPSTGLALPSWVRRSGLFPSAKLAFGDALKARFETSELRFEPPAGFLEWRRR